MIFIPLPGIAYRGSINHVLVGIPVYWVLVLVGTETVFGMSQR